MPDFGYDPLRLSLPRPISPPGAIERLIATYRLWRRGAHERDLLARFDDQALRDIAVTRADAERELAKPFWRA